MRKKIVATTEGGAITGEERLREHTDQLYGAILSYEGKPATYQIAYIDTLKRELDEVTKAIRSTPRAGPARIKRLPQIQRPTATFAAGGESRYQWFGRQRDWRDSRVPAWLPADFRIWSSTGSVRTRSPHSETFEWFCGRLEVNLSSPMERKPAVAVVFHHIGPYHHARLNAAADRLSVTGIEWSAKGYDAWGAAATPARYHKVSLFPEATDHSPGNAELQCAFWSALEQANPDVVAVNGWNNFGSLIAANCCVRRGIPMVVMSESSRQDEPRTWWKEAIKRRIVGLYSAALVGGQRHVEYLVELGMPRERIFTGYDVVDNDYFGRRTAEIRNSEIRDSK